MNWKPIIGITVAHYTEELRTFPREYYVEMIRKAGGIPFLIPIVHTLEEASEVLQHIDGFLLTGGGDISPLYLGEHPLYGIGDCFPERDQSEILLTRSAILQGIPLLGICRGIQVLAVAAGGKIYQDISRQYPGALQHAQTAPRNHVWHEIRIMDSKLADILGEQRILVNSLHHQAVSEIPEGFSKSAMAPDGIIEGIEKSGAKFCLGLQWHPEAMPNDRHSMDIFNAFIKACQGESS